MQRGKLRLLRDKKLAQGPLVTQVSHRPGAQRAQYALVVLKALHGEREHACPDSPDSHLGGC